MLMRDVESYLAVRRAAGFELRRVERYLLSFARFAEARGETHVRADTAIKWSALPAATLQWHYRLRAVLNLARYLRAEDARHELPPEDVFVHRHRRPRPFIFTPDEVRRLVTEATRLGPAGSLRPRTYSTLFTLLAITGIRISEALALRMEDFIADGLVILESKFKKNRLVPLDSTAVAGIRRYLVQRCAVRGSDDELFVSPRGKKISYAAVYRIFRELIQKADVGPRLGVPPRIHSFRHTFAVRALEDCRGNRSEVDRRVLALSTYLGHSSIASTYWYLEATPELLADISTATAGLFSGSDR